MWKQTRAIISNCVFIVRRATELTVEVRLAYTSSSRSVSSLSLKWRSPFSFKSGEKLSPVTHFNAVALFHSSKDGAGRFSDNVFKMLSERCVAAIKPAACVHIVSYLPLPVCALWLLLCFSLRHMCWASTAPSVEWESLNYTEWTDPHRSSFFLPVDVLFIYEDHVSD